MGNGVFFDQELFAVVEGGEGDGAKLSDGIEDDGLDSFVKMCIDGGDELGVEGLGEGEIAIVGDLFEEMSPFAELGVELGGGDREAVAG